MNLGDKIKEKRLSLNIDLKQFSKKTGISINSLEQYEKGVVKIPESNVRKIAYYLGVTVQELKASTNNKKINKDNSLDSIWTDEKVLENYNKLDNFAKIKICQVMKSELKRIENK